MTQSLSVGNLNSASDIDNILHEGTAVHAHITHDQFPQTPTYLSHEQLPASVYDFEVMYLLD